MKPRSVLVMVLIVAAFAVASSAVYTVDQRQVAIKFRFGEIVESDVPPGLHVKWPWINNVIYIPTQLLTIVNQKESFLTAEKKNLDVDFFVKWRVINAADYYRAFGANELAASQRLLETVKDGIRGEFAQRSVQEVVSAERREIMSDMLNRTRDIARPLGIDVVDVRVKRIEFPDEVMGSVFDRMRSERQRIAAELRAHGAESAERIRALADRERTVILAEAYRDAEKIRGAGDAKAAETYALAYNKNPEFYSFYRSIQAYRQAIGRPGDLLVVDSDSEFFRYLNQQEDKDAQ